MRLSSRYRRLWMGEVLEVRATPGGSILEVLLGAPLISPFFGSLWAEVAPGATAASAVSDLASAAGVSPVLGSRLAALAQLGQDSAAMSEVLSAVSQSLARRGASQEQTDLYLGATENHLERVAGALGGGDAAELGSDRFARDLQWADALFAALAVDREVRAAGPSGELSLEGDPAGGASASGGDSYGNLPPVAYGDSYSMTHDSPLSVEAPGVLGNDYDPEEADLSAYLGDEPNHADGYAGFIFNGDGSFTYMPEPGFTGIDTFTYSATDGELTSDEVTVTINVIDRMPIWDAMSWGYLMDPSIYIPSEANAFPSLPVGQLHAVDPDRGVVTYTADPSSALTVATDGIVTVGPALEAVLDATASVTLNVFALNPTPVKEKLGGIAQVLQGWVEPWQISIHLESQDGQTFDPTTSGELIANLQTLRTNGDHIKELEITGHGWTEGMYVGQDKAVMQVASGMLQIGNTSVTQLFRDTTNNNSKIYLDGCHTHAFSRLARTTVGTGQWFGHRTFVIGIPGTRWTYDPRPYY